MIINHNMASLNTYNKLNANNTQTSKALEKLSSGLRINRAGDDAAGLAISEKMRGQIRGLDQASRNAQDGMSMLNTAEGNLSETQSILQRMKELATQAANDTNVGVDRGEIQKEINQLTSEINRIGNTTEFNTQKLLDGGQSAKGIKAGVTSASGAAAQGGKIVMTTATSFAKDPSTIADTDTFEFEVTDAGGNAVSFELDGKQFNTLWSQTDAAKVKAGGGAPTDQMYRDALTQVLSSMSSGATSFDLTDGTSHAVTLAEVADISISATGILSIQSKIGGEDIALKTGTKADFATLLGAGTADLAADITGTGTAQQEATIFGSKAVVGTDTFDAADWRGKMLTVSYNGRDANITLGSEFGTASDNTVTAAQIVTELNKQLDSAFGTGAVAASIATNPNNVYDTDTYFQITTDSTVMTPDGLANGDVLQGKTPSITVSGSNLDQIFGSVAAGSSAVGGTFNATFQIGANYGQTMTIDIEDMRSQALGISGTVAGANAKAKDGAIATFTKVLSASNGTDSVGTEYTLDLSTSSKATAAISVLSDAIESVSAERSKIGAFTNRLEHTVANLTTSSENMTAAESRIRDVDMAKEMMNFQKNNILSQAAQAMLAQANQQPQGVLQLLR